MARRNEDMVLSFKGLRKLIGILGMVLPAVCLLGELVFGNEGLQQSISRYYYTNVRDFFVGLMLGMAFFMMTYKGHELIDTLANLLAGFAGICVGLFPCLVPKHEGDRVGFFQLREFDSNHVHLACAGAFFLILALASLLLFTRTYKNRAPTDRKRKRNIVYIVCGCLMLVAIVADAVALQALSAQALGQTKIEFILETVMLEAFGVSWLVKGGAVLKDKLA